MLKSIISSILLTFILIMPAFTAEPKAVIEAKTEAKIGESVWLKTTNSIGKSFYWRIIPSQYETNFIVLPIFGGMTADGQPIVSYWAHYSSLEPGVIYFIFVATEGDKSDVAIHNLKYGDIIPPTPPVPPPIPPPTPPDLPAPSSALQIAVQPVISKMVYSDRTQLINDCNILQDFYTQLANMVATDSTLTTTEQIRFINVKVGTEKLANTGIKNRYIGLGTLIDSVLANQLGLQIVTLTDTKRAQIVDMFKALAWAFQQASKK